VATERTIGIGTKAPLGTNPTELPASLPATYSVQKHWKINLMRILCFLFL
jgi:hypothetical protein